MLENPTKSKKDEIFNLAKARQCMYVCGYGNKILFNNRA